MIILRKILLFKYLYILLFIISLIYLVIYINIDFASKFKEGDFKVEATVLNIKYQGNKMTLTLESLEKFIATYYFTSLNELKKIKNELSLGDVLKLEGEFFKPSSNYNFYSFSYPAYLKYQNIHYIMKVSKFSIKNKNSNILNCIKNGVKNSVSDNKVGKYIKVFFLGDDSNFDIELKDNFQKIGISHLFALSGTQLSFIIMFLSLFNRKSYDFKKFIFIFSILLIYYLLIESCAAIDRALIFSIVFYLNKTFNFEIKPLFLILLSLSILIFINPYYIYDIGFQYSTVISCVLILYMNNRKSRSKIGELFKISWVSFLVSLPISLYHFSYINPFSIIYNLFYVPFINIIIFPLSMITFFLPFLANILLFFINIFEFTVNFLASFNFGYIVLGRLNIIYYFLYALFIFFYLFSKRKNTIFLIVIVLMIVIHYFYPKLFCHDRLYMIDVGQGDAILLISNSKTMLIDTGGTMQFYKEKWMQYDKNSQGKYIITFLYQLGITELDFLILTHGDYDHIGEALTIMKSIKVKNVFFNNNRLNDLEKAIWIKSNNPYKLKEGDSFNLGKFKFLVISHKYDDENDSSIVLYSSIYNKKILFMGDASIKSEEYILNNYDINDVTILKIGHHGSRTSSSDKFIETVNPIYALISSGINNRFNHPHEEVLERLKEKSSIIFNTQINGMIMFDFTNNKIETYK